MDAAHHLLPHGGRGVAAGHDALVVDVAHPHGAAVIRGVAHEIAVLIVVGGTGLTGHVHTADPALIAGTAVDYLLQEAVHQRGSGVLHGHGGLGLVLQHHVAVGILHADEGAGRGVDALVGESAEGGGHLLSGDAAVQTAQTHVAHLLGILIRQGGEAQLAGHEVIGPAGAVFLHHADGAGVGRPCDGGVQRGQAHVAAVGILGVSGAVEHHHRIVVDGAGAVDGAVIQSGGVDGHGLDGRTALPCAGGPVPAAVHLLDAGAAHHGHHIAGVGVHDGHAHLQLLRLRLTVGIGVRGGVGQVGRIGADLLRDLLVGGVLGGVDLVALAVDHVDALLKGRGHLAVGIGDVGKAVLLHQSGGHVVDDRVGEVGLAGGGGGLLGILLGIAAGGVAGGVAGVVAGGVLLALIAAHIVALNGVAVGKHHLLGLGGLVGGLVDGTLLIQGAQHQQLALAVVLTAPVRPQGIVQRGVVGDGDQTGALRQRQLRHVLIEVGQRRRHHAVAAAAEVHLVEVRLQNLVLFVALLQIQSAVDLRDLALHGVLVVAGDVLHQLLGDGGAALDISAEQGAEDGAGGAVPVHAVVLVKALVLNGHHSLLQVLGDLVQVGPDAVLGIQKQRLVHGPFLSGWLLIIQLCGYLRLKLVQIDLDVPAHAAVDVGAENTGKNGHGQHHHQQDRADDAAGGVPAAAAGSTLLSVIVYLSGALRPVRAAGSLSASAFIHYRAPSFLCWFYWWAECRTFPRKPYKNPLYGLFYHACQLPKTCYFRKNRPFGRAESLYFPRFRWFSVPRRRKRRQNRTCIFPWKPL